MSETTTHAGWDERSKRLIERLEAAVAANAQGCARILGGQIREHEAVYMPELPGEKCLSDREIYIFHAAFNRGVEAALAMLKDAAQDGPNLLEGLFAQNGKPAQD